jgi:SHS2 domain-containing protein
MERTFIPDPGYSWTEEHTADVWIVGESADVSTTLSSMIVTLYSLISEGYDLLDEANLSFNIEAGSPEEALVRLLSEVLYLLEGEGLVLTDVEISYHEGGERVRMAVKAVSHHFGIPAGRAGMEVKAITYHGSSLTYDSQGGLFRARVLVDI